MYVSIIWSCTDVLLPSHLMHLVYFSQVELVINQYIWVVILVLKMAIIYLDVGVSIYLLERNYITFAFYFQCSYYCSPISPLIYALISCFYRVGWLVNSFIFDWSFIVHISQHTHLLACVIYNLKYTILRLEFLTSGYNTLFWCRYLEFSFIYLFSISRSFERDAYILENYYWLYSLLVS